MNLKQLTYEDIKKLYIEHMIIDFPAEELKPLDVIQKLIKRKIYMGYGLYNNEELLAYAFLAVSKSYLLIDYYSVCRRYRNKGIGSEFLKILKNNCKNYKGMIVEVESIESAPNIIEKETRERRISFYKKNGMKMTTISCDLFNVNYSIMCLSNDIIEDSSIYEGLKNIYKDIIPSKLYLENVNIKMINI